MILGRDHADADEATGGRMILSLGVSHRPVPLSGAAPLRRGSSVAPEEYARRMVFAEELHADEVDKMPHTPRRTGCLPTCSSIRLSERQAPRAE